MKKTPKTTARKHESTSVHDVSRGTSVHADNWRERANSKPLTLVRTKRY